MSGSGRAGNGRGNNRRRPFRWRDNDSSKNITASQKGDTSQKNDKPELNESYGSGGKGERKSQDRGKYQEHRAADAAWSETRQGRGSPPGNNQNRQDRNNPQKKPGDNTRNPAAFVERQKWVPPKLNTDPLPVPDCVFCGKPIRDISSAMADRNTGSPVHFDCVVSRISANEILEKGDIITYIGGGRFGIVNFPGLKISPAAASPAAVKPAEDKAEYNSFKIKKIIEWESNDKRAEWRSLICDHFSVT